MNILLIGNGLDLAHGLPTKYDDFIFFIEYIEQKYLLFKHGQGKLGPALPKSDNNKSREILTNLIENDINEIFDNEQLDEFYNKIDDFFKNNLWFKYFLYISKNNEKIGTNWIDFESEISNVIEFFEINRIKSDQKVIIPLLGNKKTTFLYNETINKRNRINKELKSMNDHIGFIDVLEKDLEEFCRFLQMYLGCFVSRLKFDKLDFINRISIDRVISFNYTDTYKRYRKNIPQKNYNFIHGEASFKSEDWFEQKSSIVLGANETLNDEQTNTNVSFIKFKKYYQRIQKRTDNEYIKWLERIAEQHENYAQNKKDYKKIKRAIRYFKNENDSVVKRFISKNLKLKRYRKYFHNLYIIGHSLDVTDADVLRTLIVNDNVKTTIYYHNEQSYHEKLSNLIKIIGKDEVIKRTSGKYQTIFFEDQNNPKIQKNKIIKSKGSTL